MPILHHDHLTAPGATPGRWLFLLHGIYGAGRNWASLMRRVVRERPEWGTVLVDLREHGASRGFPPPHTLEAAAGDLNALADALGTVPDAVLGHSFGGKVGLAYARRSGGGLKQLWVVDSTPDARPAGGSAAQMLGVLRRNPGPFESREAALRALEAEGLATGVAQWMSTNLEPVGEAYRWRLDVDAMEALLRDFFATDLWDVVEQPPPGLRIHFIKAEGSDVLGEEACDRIEAAGRSNGRVALHRVAGGHWLNADNPGAVEELLRAHL